MAIVAISMLVTGCVDRPPEDATGEEIFLQLCSNCHGSDLSGGVGPALGPGSNASERSDEFFRVTVNGGRGRMPSFRTTLQDDQLDRLIRFVREEQEG